MYSIASLVVVMVCHLTTLIPLCSWQRMPFFHRLLFVHTPPSNYPELWLIRKRKMMNRTRNRKLNWNRNPIAIEIRTGNGSGEIGLYVAGLALRTSIILMIDGYKSTAIASDITKSTSGRISDIKFCKFFNSSNSYKICWNSIKGFTSIRARVKDATAIKGYVVGRMRLMASNTCQLVVKC